MQHLAAQKTGARLTTDQLCYGTTVLMIPANEYESQKNQNHTIWTVFKEKVFNNILNNETNCDMPST